MVSLKKKSNKNTFHVKILSVHIIEINSQTVELYRQKHHCLKWYHNTHFFNLGGRHATGGLEKAPLPNISVCFLCNIAWQIWHTFCASDLMQIFCIFLKCPNWKEQQIQVFFIVIINQSHMWFDLSATKLHLV